MSIRFAGLKFVCSMPVHDAIALRQVNFHQAASARPAAATPGSRLVHGAMGGAHQPMPGQVKKPVGLVIHFHRHMAAAVQVGMDLPPIAHRKGPAGSAR